MEGRRETEASVEVEEQGNDLEWQTWNEEEGSGTQLLPENEPQNEAGGQAAIIRAETGPDNRHGMVRKQLDQEIECHEEVDLETCGETEWQLSWDSKGGTGTQLLAENEPQDDSTVPSGGRGSTQSIEDDRGSSKRGGGDADAEEYVIALAE
jgi:hypothetical protein